MTIPLSRASVPLVAAACVCTSTLGCRRTSAPPASPSDVVLTIGVPFQFGSATTGVASLAGSLNEESLVRINRDGRAVDTLAASRTVSADGLTVQVRLKPNVRFHDGSPLTPDMVKASLERSMKSAAALHPFLQDIASIEPSADDGLTFRLHRPSPLLFENLDVPIVRSIAGKDVGPGPFHFLTTGKEPSLRANPHYYRGKPPIDVIRFKTYQALRPAWAALMRGEIDFLHDVGPDSRPFAEQETSIRLYPYQRGFGTVLVPNMRRATFQPASVRKALSLAIDRREIIDRAFRGRGIPSSGLWPRHWIYRGRVTEPEFDPRRADAMLSAEGYVRPAHVARAIDRMPSRLRFTCLVPPQFGAMERVALLIQHQLYAIDVDMQIEPLPVVQLIERVQKGDFDAVLMDMTGGPALARAYYIWHSTAQRGLVDLGYRAADAAFDKIRHARDEATAYEGADELRRIFTDDPPAIFINWSEAARAVSRRFEAEAEPGRDVFGALWRMQPVSQRTQR